MQDFLFFFKHCCNSYRVCYIILIIDYNIREIEKNISIFANNGICVDIRVVDIKQSSLRHKNTVIM